LKARPEIDAGRVGMAGLSYGGLYTLYAMAASPKIRAGACSGYFGVPDSMDPINGADRRFFDMLNTFGQVEIAGLIYPRALMIQNGVEDTVVPIKGARRNAPMVAALYERLNLTNRFAYQEYPARHEFH